jgi:hypothetical protein
MLARFAVVSALLAATFSAGVYVGHSRNQIFSFMVIMQRKLLGFNELGQLARSNSREIACPDQTGRTLVAVVFGQSNASNALRQKHQGKPNVVNLYDGRCFAASDPLLGNTETGGSVWVLTANLVADRFDHVILVPMAMGGTSIRQWAGELDGMVAQTLEGVKKRYTATHFLWHQGESDAHLTSPKIYRASLDRLVARTRSYFPDSIFLVSIATYCRSQIDPDIQLAQRAAVDPARNIFAGPDTDAFTDPEDRLDGCHLSPIGQEKVANAWARALTQAVDVRQARPTVK